MSETYLCTSRNLSVKMPSSCKVCTQAISKKSPGLQCSGSCGKFFHARCVNIPASAVGVFVSPGTSWKCPDCRSEMDASAVLLEDEAETDVDAPSLSAIYKTLQRIQADIKSINNKYDALMESVNFCSDKVSDFEKALSDLSTKCQTISKIENENANLKVEIAELRNQVQDMEQHSKLNNLEIQGVPQKDNENLFEILQKIGSTIQCNINPSDINAVHRVAQLNAHSPHPRNIIVSFISRCKRNEILAAAKVARRSNNSVNRGLAVPQIADQVFINEHLTLFKKSLMYKARQEVRSKNYKYLWVKNGNIYCRKDDRSHVLSIRQCADIAKIA